MTRWPIRNRIRNWLYWHWPVGLRTRLSYGRQVTKEREHAQQLNSWLNIANLTVIRQNMERQRLGLRIAAQRRQIRRLRGTLGEAYKLLATRVPADRLSEANRSLGECLTALDGLCVAVERVAHVQGWADEWGSFESGTLPMLHILRDALTVARSALVPSAGTREGTAQKG